MTVPANKDRPATRRTVVTVIVIITLLLLVAVIVVTGKRQKKEPPVETTPEETVQKDTAVGTPAIADSIRTPDTIQPEVKEVVTRPVKTKKQATAGTVRADTTPALPDSVVTETAARETATPSKKCAQDTLLPWVYPDPSGGLHQGPVTLRFLMNKTCAISWRRASVEEWNHYDGGVITLTESDAILYHATDSCGNVMATREELYDIEREKTASVCPETMDLVTVAGTRFCIDRYEWPNRKGALPIAYVSLHQAADSCFSKGKRLCTSEEWSLACGGPYSWAYPYGQEYEPHACATSDSAPRPSGSRPECRAYFGTFDMAGNLAEWTSTPAKQDRNFNNVVGGFWESGPRSGCFEKRYSYYPQNRHNPVGFRCCRDSRGQ